MLKVTQNLGFSTKKVVQAFHQHGQIQYGDSAGMRWISNAYLAVKNIGLWKSYGLDCLLDQRNRIFRSVGINEPLAVGELPLKITIKGASASVRWFLACESSLLIETNYCFYLFENFRQ